MENASKSDKQHLFSITEHLRCMSAKTAGIAIIPVPEGKLLGKAALPGKPQGIIVEKKRQRIFANVFNVKQIAVIDSNKRKTS